MFRWAWLIVVIVPLGSLVNGDEGTVNGNGRAGRDVTTKPRAELAMVGDPPHVFVKGIIGRRGRECTLLLDTGHSFTSVSDAKHHNNLGGPPDVRLSKGMDSVKDAVHLELDRLRVGNIDVARHKVIVFADLRPFVEGIGTPFEAILGGHTLKERVVELDFEGRLAVLSSHPGEVAAGETYPLALLQDVPFVSVSIGRQISCLIDTGSVFPFSLTEEDACRLDGPSAHVARLSFGKSQVGVLRNEMLVARRIRVGTDIVYDALGPVGHVSTLGLPLLSRHRIMLDYPRRQVRFEPRKELPERIPPDASGLAFRRNEFGTFVMDVYLNSCAYRAGLRARDRVISVDRRPVEQFSISSLENHLTQDGEKIEFLIERLVEEGSATVKPAPPVYERIRFAFTLKRMFEWPPIWPDPPLREKTIPLD
jgi:hypothetical protein